MWRVFSHHPGYIVLSVLTIALAIGANLTVFTIVNAIWLRPRAIPEIDRVVMVLGVNDSTATSDGVYFTELGLDCQLRSLPIFEHVAGQVGTSGHSAGYEPHVFLDRAGREIETLAVGRQYFSVIGAPIRGRDFTADDNRPEAEPVAIMSHRLWQSGFDADPAVVGSVVDASPLPLRIIGIAPVGFHGARLGEQADAWIPPQLVLRVARPGMADVRREALLPIARLRQGVSLQQAQQAVAGARCNDRPRSPLSPPLAVVPVAKTYGGPQSRTIVTDESGAVLLVGGMAWILFAGGCVTLLSVVLMHFERRQLAFAVRLALGSSPRRLSRDLARELAVIGVLGLGAAVALSSAVLGTLPSLRFTAGVDFARLDLMPDWRVGLFGVAGLMLTLALGGALPVRRATRYRIVGALTSGVATGSRSSLRLRRILLVLHVAGVAIVLVGAGLLIRTVQVGFSQGAAFDLTRTLFVFAQVSPSTALSGPSREARAAAQEALVASRAARFVDLFDRISRLSGVHLVTFGRPPIGLEQAVAATRPTTLVTDAGQWTGTVGVSAVGAGFLEVLGVPLLAGRALARADAWTFGQGQLRSAVVTPALAASVWPGRSPLGQRFAIEKTPFEVVGVIGNHPQGSVRLGEEKAIYTAIDVDSAAQRFTLELAVRAAGDAASLVRPVRQALDAVFPHAVRVDLATGHDTVARDLGREVVGASAFGLFGVLALCLGLAGVYGLVAYYVESRQREVGVRIALGATARHLVWATMSVGLAPVAAGAGIGLAVAAVLARILQVSVFGIARLDPITYLGVGLLLIGTASAAALLGTRRLRRLTPVEMLRVS